ncbi:WD40-repeat-containing domain protein [Haematococcus lacustris]
MVPRPAAAAPAEPDGATTTSGPNDTKKSKKQRRSKEDKAKAARLDKGPGVHIKKVIDKKLKGKLRHAEAVFREAHEKAVKANEWLLPAEAGFLEAEAAERTWNAQQRDLAGAVELGAARKLFELRLPDLGPYSLAFTRNGRHCALAGALGHLAVMDWQRQQLVCEVQVREATHDICFLHNETFFAAAQKKYVYIYDKRGVEVHCLREHQGARILQFLPHHFLLASIGDLGVLRYQDTSTGVVAAQHRTRLGPCSALRLNPWNAVLGAGHSGGVVTMWTPNLPTPVVRMLCHRGRVNALAFDPAGRYMVTAGADSQVKVWDVRTYQPLHAYFAYSPATVLDISQRGLLAVGYGRKVQIWKDALSSKANAPYMSHSLYEGDQLSDAQFVGYEDVMGLGSSGGMSTILVPGAGEPNFDSMVANPYASLRERREGEVAALLDKLQPDTIVLDPDSIARVRKEPAEVLKEKRLEAAAATKERRAAAEEKNEAKSKMKGKNRPSKRHRKKQTNIIEERKPVVKQRMKEQEQQRAQALQEAAQHKAASAAAAIANVPRALQRMYTKA